MPRLFDDTSGLIFKKSPFQKFHLHLITLSRVRSQGMIDYIIYGIYYGISVIFVPEIHDKNNSISNLIKVSKNFDINWRNP